MWSPSVTPDIALRLQIVDLTASPFGMVNVELKRDTSKDIPNVARAACDRDPQISASNHPQKSPGRTGRREELLIAEA